jgi:hypothetical protein
MISPEELAKEKRQKRLQIVFGIFVALWFVFVVGLVMSRWAG